MVEQVLKIVGALVSALGMYVRIHDTDHERPHDTYVKCPDWLCFARMEVRLESTVHSISGGGGV